MAKKTVAFVWMCSETNMPTGSGRARPEKIKELQRMKFSAKLHKHTLHKAKAVKKGGTKKDLNRK